MFGYILGLFPGKIKSKKGKKKDPDNYPGFSLVLDNSRSLQKPKNNKPSLSHTSLMVQKVIQQEERERVSESSVVVVVVVVEEEDIPFPFFKKHIHTT